MVQGEESQVYINFAELKFWRLEFQGAAQSYVSKFQKEGSCAEKEIQKFACDLPKVLLSTRVKSH